MNKTTASKMNMPKRGSRAAAGYFSSWKEIDRFFRFVLVMASRSEEVGNTAHQALINLESDENKKKSMIEKWKKRHTAMDELKANRQFFLEVIHVRHVENFLGYLAALLYEIFTQRPETLRSSEHIEVEKVLKHDSIESLVREIAERKVESLSYGSFSELAKFFSDRFGLVLVEDADSLKKITLAIEVRNISVHNRCIINQRFLKRTGLDSVNLGKKKELFADDITSFTPLVASLVSDIDRQAIAKLKLKGILFNAREKKSEASAGVPMGAN